MTTVITGNCGRSFEENHGDSDLKSYDLQHGQVNVAAFVGHNSIRDKIMGKRRDDPSASDLEMMRKEVESAMRAGALGLSLGLEYFPGIISKKEELAFLAAESARWGGLLTAHVRNEGSALNESLDEVIEVADKARSPLHVSHLKIACQKDWGKMSEVLNKLKQARSKLKSLTYDAYAYNASSSSQDLMLPPEFRGSAWRARKSLEDPEQRRRMIEGMVAQMRREGFHDYSFARVSWFREPLLQGHFVSDDWSKLTTQRSYGWLKELVVEPELCRHIANILTIIEGGGAQMIYHVMDPKDVATVIADPFALIGSDSGVRGDNDNTTHPRGSGNTARVLEESVSGRQDFTMEQALHKLTKQSAEVFRLTGRGTIAEGVPADIVVFDPKRIKDTTTWDSPLSAPNGIEYVMVAGQFVYRDGKVIKNYPGRALRAAVTEPTRPAAILRAEPAVQPVREPEEKKPVKRPRKGKGKRN